MNSQNDAFRQGVEPGGMFDKNDVRLLICCLLADCGRPLSKDVIVGGLFGSGLANYFELGAAAEDLLERGLLQVAERTDSALRLTVTREGRKAVDELGGAIPASARKKAVDGVLYFEAAERRRRENSVEVRPAAGGRAVTLHAGTPEDPLMSLTVYVPDGLLADAMRKKMESEPEKLCEKVFRILLEE